MGNGKDSRMAMGLNNFGVAFNVHQGAGTVTGFTFGVGYSRMADYNYRGKFKYSDRNTIMDMYTNQVALFHNSGGDFNHPYDADMNSMGAMLAWETGQIDVFEEMVGENLMSIYYPWGVGPGTTTAKHTSTLSQGSAGEYVFSGGWNFKNRFYAGFSVGMVDIYQNREVLYSERYENNDTADDPATLRMTYNQRMKTVGEGVNFKAGFVYRPISDLRLGFAFHSPTIASVRDRYDSWMRSEYTDGIVTRETPGNPEWNEFEERFYTPARLLAGVSYIFFDSGVLSIDYEHAFYNGMGVRGDEYGFIPTGEVETYKELVRESVKSSFKGSNTLRAGLEVMADDMVYLRAGYSFSKLGVKDNWMPDVPLAVEEQRASVGAGFKIGRHTSFDIAYSLTDTKYSDYDLFAYEPSSGGSVISSDELTKLKSIRHNVLLSLNWRF